MLKALKRTVFFQYSESKPEVLSRHNRDASALTTVKTWLFSHMQIDSVIVVSFCVVNSEKLSLGLQDYREQLKKGSFWKDRMVLLML